MEKLFRENTYELQGSGYHGGRSRERREGELGLLCDCDHLFL